MNEEQQSVERTETSEQVGDTQVERQTVKQSAAVSGRVVLSRFIWFVVGVIVTLLAVRIVLQLLAANQGNAFVDFVYSLSAVFAAPFFGVFGYEPSYGSSVFEISSLVAILVYALVGWGVVKLINIASPSGEAA